MPRMLRSLALSRGKRRPIDGLAKQSSNAARHSLVMAFRNTMRACNAGLNFDCRPNLTQAGHKLCEARAEFGGAALAANADLRRGLEDIPHEDRRRRSRVGQFATLVQPIEPKIIDRIERSNFLFEQRSVCGMPQIHLC